MKLTEIARKTLENYFAGKKFSPDESTKKEFGEKRACFVTLTINGGLRGCIGSLEARQELWKDVMQNAVNAAFNDPRFPPLSKEELKRIKIEVSVLSEKKKLSYKDEKDLLEKIDNKMGIIIKKNGYSATFLPQVWEQLPDKIEFLEQLSLKAGLNKDSWKQSEIFYYRVEAEEE